MNIMVFKGMNSQANKIARDLAAMNGNPGNGNEKKSTLSHPHLRIA